MSDTNPNLTDSQRNLLAAFRREMEDVSGEIMAEIRQLRQEQTERHAEGLKREKSLFEGFKNDLRRHALGLLALAGMSDEEIAEWQRKKGR